MKNIVSKQILKIAEENQILLTRDFQDDLERIERKVNLYTLLTDNFKTKDGKLLSDGDSFYAVCTTGTMSSSGCHKFVPIELKFPKDWNELQIAYSSKKECLKECKRRNILAQSCSQAE
ncbi:hypothetical protein [Flavobacterium sp.]|uniref:hypothetical protein n=1 Tax=Flavobacterium sp. TaxID=239 RepID=UPI0040480F8B